MDASRARIARLRAALCLAGLIAWGNTARSDDGASEVAAAPPGVASPTDARLWALVPPERHEPPEVARDDWPLRRIDRFILARLEREGIEPAKPADRRALLRRLSFDLTGLPPSPEDVERFVRDSSPDAYEREVERLLASPRYGERWARLWLDVARYAEDQAHIVGNDRSLCYPNAWLYRDWVVDALNEDLPYDRFVTLQLAADLVAKEEGIEDERPKD
ncbi:MAG TPA: DUF1549 domain-containing protein, partial [Planctomycetota bacterium]|nr:DUF1549 domain-containing protein [Planctomycetota bacterium]